MVADRQATGRSAGGERQQLMTQADAQDRWPTRLGRGRQRRHRGDLRCHARWIAGAGRQDDEVGAMGSHVGRTRVMWQDRDLQAARCERSQQGALDAVVDQYRPTPLLARGSHDVRRSGRDGRHVIDRLPGRAIDRLLDGVATFGITLFVGFGSAADHGPSGGAAPQRQCQRTGVDALQRRNAGLDQQVLQ